MSREAFEKWLLREMPAGTVISDPLWWAPRIWQAAQVQASKPIAAVHGWFHGECVIRPLDPEAVLPAGMALYSQPQAQAGDVQLLEALQHIMKMQTFGYIVLGEEATTKAQAAIAAAQEQSK